MRARSWTELYIISSIDFKELRPSTYLWVSVVSVTLLFCIVDDRQTNRARLWSTMVGVSISKVCIYLIGSTELLLR